MMHKHVIGFICVLPRLSHMENEEINAYVYNILHMWEFMKLTCTICVVMLHTS